ncbi:MAG: DUF3043 domain-containing protein [Actinomycetota bacterium]|nr:DUF3043 domain-containing protein [Actinomycetota bacterium]
MLGRRTQDRGQDTSASAVEKAGTGASGSGGSGATAVDKAALDKAGGKGRPTPSRREAEALRRQRVKPQVDRKTRTRQHREKLRAERLKAREALMTGDEANMPARDRGPVRRFVRDVVDARHGVAQYYLPVAVVVLLLSFFRHPLIAVITVYGLLLMMILVFLDTGLLIVTLRRRLREKFPDGDTRRAVSYGVARSLQMRRLRLPPPRVKHGEKVS